MQVNDALTRAMEIAGGRAKLAELLGLTPQAISLWHGTVPSRRAIQIEDITRGRVTRAELRPDFFGIPAKRGRRAA